MENRDSFTRPPAPSYAHGTQTAKGVAVPTGGDTAATNLTSSSGLSSSLTLSPPHFLQQIHAAVKRQRPFGPMQSKLPRATRVLVSGGERANKIGANPSVSKDQERIVTQPQRGMLGPSMLPNVTPDQQKVDSTSKLGSSAPDELMLTAPSMLKSTTDTCAQRVGQQKNKANLLMDTEKSAFDALSSQITSCNALMGESFKKGQLDSVVNPQLTSQRDNFPANQGAQNDHQKNHQELQTVDIAADMDIEYDASNLSRRGIQEARNQNHGKHMIPFSAIGSSVTAMSLHSGPTVQSSQTPQVGGYTSPVQIPESAVESSKGALGHGAQKEHAGATGVGDWNPHNQQVQNLGNGATDKAVSSIGRLRSEGLPANDQSTSARDGGGSRPNKGEKERRKKNYDPNVFFKVNGKLYQKLGKIGSGGSSEVHKVISSDCIIYALKKIKLRGRDYPTAYGFCQEIEYLNKLKGRSNIIQMIDYEVPSSQPYLQKEILFWYLCPTKTGH
uniref:Protein kinase domain-containing protein n=1 Tax=Zea mays TaxID=4577 RepID=A0A804M2K2_MAIZE